MPNYTQNHLYVRGEQRLLRYFYEKNRITEEDYEMLGSDWRPTDLSFRKMVPRDTANILVYYIDKKCKSICGKEENILDLYDLYCEFWSTKWDAGDASVNLSKIEEGEISYSFETAWYYPKNWLITISTLFPKLDFKLHCTHEDDGYDMQFEYLYKDGIEKEIHQYSLFEKKMEELGGYEKVIDDCIEFLENNDFEYKENGETHNFEGYVKYMKNIGRDVVYNIYKMNNKFENYLDERMGRIVHLFFSQETNKRFYKKINEKSN
jgi:hypothetical protein